MLSTAEIAAKYPANFACPFDRWMVHLADWRRRDILTPERHWTFERRLGPRPAYCYLESYILKVVWKNIDASPFCYTIYKHHKETILLTLQTVQSAHVLAIPSPNR